MKCYLGIDTSCYTTSLALLDAKGHLLADHRRGLKVKPGSRGLAQSEMVFQHMRNLPVLLEEATALCGNRLPQPLAIGVSASPRSLESSYMPAFVAGESFARVLAAALQAPLFRLSHQENHILAGIRCVGWPEGREFLGVHLSGGTTETAKVTVGSAGLQVEIIGGSIDLHAGQFIDRVGVALGLAFPAGAKLEQLAGQAETPIVIPYSCREANISFSGPESHVQRLIAEGENGANLAAGVQHCIAKSVTAMLSAAIEQTGCREVIVVGGVSANRYLRDYLAAQFNGKGITLLFPEPCYSPDNATGAAYFAYWRCTQTTASA